MTWLEAMAMEKALVTSELGWAKEVMIDGVTGFAVAPKAHQKYAGKVLHLLNDPVLALKMGKAAREQVVAKFSAEVVVERNIGFYEKIRIARIKTNYAPQRFGVGFGKKMRITRIKTNYAD